MKASRSENAGRRYPPNPWEREPSRLAPPGGSAGSVLMVAAAPNRASRCPPRMPAVGRKPQACTGYMQEQGKGSGQPRAAHSHVSQYRARARRPARLSQSVRMAKKVKVQGIGFVTTAAIQGLQNGTCDALAYWSPVMEQAVDSGAAHFSPGIELNRA